MMCVLTWIPAPRSPSLGNGSLSIIRTGIPFFRSDRARTRPKDPRQPTKIIIQTELVASCCKAYNEYRLHVPYGKDVEGWWMNLIYITRRVMLLPSPQIEPRQAYHVVSVVDVHVSLLINLSFSPKHVTFDKQQSGGSFLGTSSSSQPITILKIGQYRGADIINISSLHQRRLHLLKAERPGPRIKHHRQQVKPLGQLF
jgi:hypothetical protein